jgi:serine/threonine protein kinase
MKNRLDKLTAPLPRHDNIVQILKYQMLDRPEALTMDMEFCDINLHRYINRHETADFAEPPVEIPAYLSHHPSQPFKAWNVVAIMRDISCGLEFLHSHGFVHRLAQPRDSKNFTLLR